MPLFFPIPSTLRSPSFSLEYRQAVIVEGFFSSTEEKHIFRLSRTNGLDFHEHVNPTNAIAFVRKAVQEAERSRTQGGARGSGLTSNFSTLGKRILRNDATGRLKFSILVASWLAVDFRHQRGGLGLQSTHLSSMGIFGHNFASPTLQY